MALKNATCVRCKATIQLESSTRTGFCLNCGARLVVAEAIKQYEKDHPHEEPAEQVEVISANMVDDLMLQAEVYLGQGVFDAAESTYRSLLSRDPKSAKAQWGLVLAKTQNLAAFPLRSAEDYAYHTAIDLFQNETAPEREEWKEAYMDAFNKCCFMTIDAIDPRVFLEVEIFRWYTKSNTFLYPISRGFDLQQVFDKVLWEEWNGLKELLPPEHQDAFVEHAEACCRKIWDYFDSGFSSMEDLRNGDLSRLMGVWQLKLTTGAIKSDVLKFSTNSASVSHLETCRLKFNHYDYYRFLKMDSANHVLAGEHRHFPSTMGTGGDFTSHPQYEAVIGIMAVYDYILVLPTALYIRTDAKKIPGYDRAIQFQKKCHAMPCFQRNGLKSAVQIRPISENHDTGDTSRKVKACYIATAVYGDVEAPQVLRLRRFRDETLHKTRFGQGVSAFYYRHSPGFAKRLERATPINRMVRGLLNLWLRFLK